MRLTAAGGADYCYAGRWCRGLGVEVDGGGGADYCYAGRWCRGWDGDRAAHIRRRLGNLNAGRWCRGLGWDGMGGLRFTAPGLSSRVAVNLNPPRHAGILKLAAAAAARLTSLPRRRGLRLRLTATRRGLLLCRAMVSGLRLGW